MNRYIFSEKIQAHSTFHSEDVQNLDHDIINRLLTNTGLIVTDDLDTTFKKLKDMEINNIVSIDSLRHSKSKIKFKRFDSAVYAQFIDERNLSIDVEIIEQMRKTFKNVCATITSIENKIFEIIYVKKNKDDYSVLMYKYEFDILLESKQRTLLKELTVSFNIGLS